MLHLDGRNFSGSGTIVRFGMPLAALAGQDLHLTHIRARRDPPELRPQHLTAVELVERILGAHVHLEDHQLSIQGIGYTSSH